MIAERYNISDLATIYHDDAKEKRFGGIVNVQMGYDNYIETASLSKYTRRYN